MLRKFFAAVLLVSFVACGAAFAASEAELQQQAIAEAMAAMANEPPITQADIDAFLTMAPQADAVMNDPVATVKLYQDNNMTPQRFGVIGGKISIGILLSQGITKEQLASFGQFPDYMVPNDAEQALIDKNIDTIMAVMDEVAE